MGLGGLAIANGTAALGSLERSVIALGQEDIGVCSAAELGQGIRRLRGVVDRLEAETIRRLRRFEELDGPMAAGAPSAVAFLQFECGMDTWGASQRALMARERENSAATAAALTTEQISFDQAAIIMSGVAQVDPKDAAEVERRTLEAATLGMEPRKLRHFTKGVVAEVDSERLRRDSRRAAARRFLTIGQDRDGSVRIEGLLESETAAYLRTVTDALMGPKVASDERSPKQRRHDALRDALKRMLNGGAKLPSVGGARAQVYVVAALSTMVGEPGPPALLQGLVPISREKLLELAAEGTLSATLMHANGKVAYAGKARRFSRAMRRAMAACLAGCQWPGGCDRPVEWCDGHHIEPVAAGGVTMPENGMLLCGFHHALIEDHGWAVVDGPDGRQTPLPPDHPDNPRAAERAFSEANRRRRGAESKEVGGAVRTTRLLQRAGP
jgi:hypothetical protein